MKNPSLLTRSLASMLACGVLILAAGQVQAQHMGGGGHGGSAPHGSPGGHSGGFGGGGRPAYGGGYRGPEGYRGYYGGYRGYGYRGYYGGYRGYYGYPGWGYGPGWGWGGVGLGMYVGALPLYYSTVWWDGVPYYYSNDVYYRYDGSVGKYETVEPPAEVQKQAESAAQSGVDTVGTDLIAYPKNGQSTEQQATDKYECHHWATTQSGFDPTRGAEEGASAASTATRRSDYMRAQAACLEGRGYSVK